MAGRQLLISPQAAHFKRMILGAAELAADVVTFDSDNLGSPSLSLSLPRPCVHIQVEKRSKLPHTNYGGIGPSAFCGAALRKPRTNGGPWLAAVTPLFPRPGKWSVARAIYRPFAAGIHHPPENAPALGAQIFVQ